MVRSVPQQRAEPRALEPPLEEVLLRGRCDRYQGLEWAGGRCARRRLTCPEEFGGAIIELVAVLALYAGLFATLLTVPNVSQTLKARHLAINNLVANLLASSLNVVVVAEDGATMLHPELTPQMLKAVNEKAGNVLVEVDPAICAAVAAVNVCSSNSVVVLAEHMKCISNQGSAVDGNQVPESIAKIAMEMLSANAKGPCSWFYLLLWDPNRSVEVVRPLSFR
jgi:hypothetical protein